MSAISWSISKIQGPTWRARQDDSNKPGYSSTRLTGKSADSQTFTSGILVSGASNEIL